MTLSEAYWYIKEHGVPSGMTGVTGMAAVKCFRAMVNGDHVGVLDGSRRCQHPPRGGRDTHRGHSTLHTHPLNTGAMDDMVTHFMATWDKP